jgi:hypothetical protein
LYIATAGLASVAIYAVRARQRTADVATAAACSIVLIGTIVLGYAAYALEHTGVFGALNRLAYPFLVATGLRVNGGACVLMLCALVSVVPLAFREAAEPSSASEPAVLGAGLVGVNELRERVLPGAHFDSR